MDFPLSPWRSATLHISVALTQDSNFNCAFPFWPSDSCSFCFAIFQNHSAHRSDYSYYAFRAFARPSFIAIPPTAELFLLRPPKPPPHLLLFVQRINPFFLFPSSGLLHLNPLAFCSASDRASRSRFSRLLSGPLNSFAFSFLLSQVCSFSAPTPEARPTILLSFPLLNFLSSLYCAVSRRFARLPLSFPEMANSLAALSRL